MGNTSVGLPAPGWATQVREKRGGDYFMGWFYPQRAESGNQNAESHASFAVPAADSSHLGVPGVARVRVRS
jgi:hypothetical protein